MERLELVIRRLRAGLKQWQVAADMGYTSAWLCKLERGKMPLTPELAQSIAKTIDTMAADAAN